VSVRKFVVKQKDLLLFNKIGSEFIFSVRKRAVVCAACLSNHSTGSFGVTFVLMFWSYVI